MIDPRRFSVFTRLVAAMVLLVSAAMLAGCTRPAPPPPKKALIEVLVAVPEIHPVTESEDFTGRTEPYRYVEIRPQVTGELREVHFKDGETVHKGAPLFEIDNRIYVAQRDSALAAKAQAEARLIGYNAVLERARDALSKKVIGQEEYDTKLADRDAGIAARDSAIASLRLAQQNLAWTHITATYSGRLSKRLVDPGNIVTANTTPLTTLIVLDPIYVGFDIDEQTLERRRDAIKAGKIPTSREEPLIVKVGLGHQEGYPFTALFSFSENQLDAATGTLHLRAEMRNPVLKLGPLQAVIGAPLAAEFWQLPPHPLSPAAEEFEKWPYRLLSPNMFVRVQLPLGRPRESLLIPDEAIGSDQGQKFVYVLNAKNEAIYRRVKPGPLGEPPFEKLRSVDEHTESSAKDEGVARGERVLISGQQRIKAGDVVKPVDPKKTSSVAAKH